MNADLEKQIGFTTKDTKERIAESAVIAGSGKAKSHHGAAGIAVIGKAKPI